MRAIVFHNIASDAIGRPLGMLDGYTAGHPLVPVADLDVLTGEAALEHIYMLFNVGDDPMMGTPDERAVAYRARKNRSLSVGDVVALIDSPKLVTWYAVASCGFDGILPPSWIVRDVTAYGTTALPMDVDLGVLAESVH